jgi:prepilin-type processing-associated H-X9-DG protein
MWTAAAVGFALLCCAAYGYFASAKNAARSGCITHLHTIYVAMSTYALDSDGELPPYALDSAGPQKADPAAFIACLTPFSLTAATWFCPADPHAKTKFKGAWSDFSLTSYGMPPATLAKGKTSDSGSFSIGLPTDAASILVCDQPVGDSSAHGPRVNAVFGDGHAAQADARSIR